MNFFALLHCIYWCYVLVFDPQTHKVKMTPDALKTPELLMLSPPGALDTNVFYKIQGIFEIHVGVLKLRLWQYWT